MSKLCFHLKVENKDLLPSEEAEIANFFICYNDNGFWDLYGEKRLFNEKFEFQFEVSRNISDLLKNIFGKTNENLRLKYSYLIISDAAAFYNKNLEEKLDELDILEPFVNENDMEVSEIYEHLFTMHYAKSATASIRR